MFLGYLAEWGAAVEAREGFSRSERKKITLSQNSLEGLRMTGTCTCTIIHVANLPTCIRIIMVMKHVHVYMNQMI